MFMSHSDSVSGVVNYVFLKDAFHTISAYVDFL